MTQCVVSMRSLLPHSMLITGIISYCCWLLLYYYAMRRRIDRNDDKKREEENIEFHTLHCARRRNKKRENIRYINQWDAWVIWRVLVISCNKYTYTWQLFHSILKWHLTRFSHPQHPPRTFIFILLARPCENCVESENNLCELIINMYAAMSIYSSWILSGLKGMKYF